MPFAAGASPATAVSGGGGGKGGGELLDRALVLWFPGPHSFTGDDVAEFHVHGSRAVTRALLGALGSLPGLRPAAAGEFARRAFLAGKLDLSAAEGLADLLNADTDAQRVQALRQVAGEHARAFARWRGELTKALAFVEASVDFSDEEDGAGALSGAQADVGRIAAELAAQLDAAASGGAADLRDGFSVAIVGAPNAGKSSLLNAIVGREAAIVSAIPGTTRDIVEARLDLGGLLVALADTAGLRETSDAVEAEGVARARRAAAEASLRLLVIDASEAAWPPSPEALLELEAAAAAAAVAPGPGGGEAAADASAAAAGAGEKRAPALATLVVLNKVDLAADRAALRRRLDAVTPLRALLAADEADEARIAADEARIARGAAGDERAAAAAPPLRNSAASADARDSSPAPAATAAFRRPVRRVHFTSCAPAAALAAAAPAPRRGGAESAAPALAALAPAHDGIGALLAAVREALAPQSRESTLFVRARHVHHAAACLAHLRAFSDKPASQLDLAAEDLRCAVAEIGKLSGHVGQEEMLDTLFANLCIGK